MCLVLVSFHKSHKNALLSRRLKWIFWIKYGVTANVSRQTGPKHFTDTETTPHVQDGDEFRFRLFILRFCGLENVASIKRVKFQF